MDDRGSIAWKNPKGISSFSTALTRFSPCSLEFKYSFRLLNMENEFFRFAEGCNKRGKQLVARFLGFGFTGFNFQ